MNVLCANDYKIHYCKVHKKTIMYFTLIRIYESVIPEPCWDCMREKYKK